MEDQTIKDIDKVEKTTPEQHNNLTDDNLMRLPLTIWIMLKLKLKMMSNIVMLTINSLDVE